ncbi:MAG: hypothetical protein C4321_01610, partial [Chloroflexota bacterium]
MQNSLFRRSYWRNRVYAYLQQESIKERSPTIQRSAQEIARAIGMSNPKNVSTVMKQLEQMGLIEIEQEIDILGRLRPNFYTILPMEAERRMMLLQLCKT